VVAQLAAEKPGTVSVAMFQLASEQSWAVERSLSDGAVASVPAVACTALTCTPAPGAVPPSGGVRVSESPVTTKCRSERVAPAGITSVLTKP
jgi:hypothetical protein